MERERIEEIQRAYSDAEEILSEIDKVNSIEEINDLINDYDFYQLTGWFELETYTDVKVDEEGLKEIKEEVKTNLENLIAWVDDMLG